MFSKRIFIYAFALVITVAMTLASAQTLERRGGWSRAVRNMDRQSLIDRALSQGTKQTSESAEMLKLSPQAKLSRKKALTGTWRISIAESATGLPPFNALQTFGEDGTFVETSDLFATLTEGPAHGAWEFKSGKFNLTFELFVFDENRQPIGKVRVKCSIQLVNDDQLTGEGSVDFIEPDGNVIPDIDSTPFTGTRVRIIPL
jgi:hypothetical protein